MRITNDIKYIGVNDHKVDLFEGQYRVPNGMAYNSYVIMDYKIAVMDTVDANFTHEWLDNLQNALGDRTPDYLIVQHMEPDHSANIVNFQKAYPDATIVSSAKAFAMLLNSLPAMPMKSLAEALAPIATTLPLDSLRAAPNGMLTDPPAGKVFTIISGWRA